MTGFLALTAAGWAERAPPPFLFSEYGERGVGVGGGNRS